MTHDNNRNTDQVPFQTITYGTPGKSLPPGRPRWSGLRKRWWAFRLLDLIARYWPVFGPRRGLLVVRIDGIGDMLMFRPTLDHYAEIFKVPKEDITIVGIPSWTDLLPICFDGYRVRFIEGRPFETDPFYRFKIALWVRRQRFAIATCDSFFRKAMIADSLVWFSAAPRQIYSAPWISRKTQAEHAYYQRSAEPAIAVGKYPTHELLRHAKFVSAIAGRPILPERLRLNWPRDRSPVPPGAPYVVLNFGCNEPGRRWPFENFRRIAEILLDRGYRVVLTGTEKEADDLQGHGDLLARPGIVSLVGKTDLKGLCDVFAGSKAVISNDTGPGHLSLALDAATIILVGGGHFGNFLPYPEGLRPANARFIYEPMECYHCLWICSKRLVDRTTFPCIREISIERVWSELAGLLEVK